MLNNISFPELGINLTVSRAAFSIGGMDLYWYGIIIAAGMLIALGYVFREASRSGIKQDDVLNMFLISVPVAIVCARLYYVVFSFEQYRGDLLSVFDIRSGGIAIYGGIIGAGLVVFTYCRRKKLNLGAVLDIMAVGFLIGQAIGRWGNFINGEAYGAVTSMPWGMTIVSDGVLRAESVHPTFLYESLWNLIGLGLLLIYKRHKTFNGEVFCAYISWYGLGRFWIEWLRADSLYLGPLKISQMIALVSIALGIAGIIYGRYKNKKIKTIGG